MDQPLNNSAELYACLYAGEFPAQAMLRLRPELRNRPCAVMEGEPPLKHICSLNASARNLGVAHGMTQVEIETFPSVTVLARSAAEEKAARSVLWECAGAFSPRMEDISRGSVFRCVMDITGTRMLFGPPQSLAEALLKRVRELGITASVAVSCNFDVAVCVARGMTPKDEVSVVPVGKEAAMLAPLPLSVLELSEEQAEKSLIARMGQEGKRLWQLGRGKRPHLFVPQECAFKLEEHMELESPVELLTSLLFVIGTMLEQLILRASAHMLALASVAITLALENKAIYTRTIRPALPSNDRQLWLKLIHLDLEAHPLQAAILSLTVSAEPGSTGNVQLGLFSPLLPEPMRLDLTVARLRAMVGEGNVGRPELNDTHRPDSFRLDGFSVPAETLSGASGQQQRLPRRQLRPAEKAVVKLRYRRPVEFSVRRKRYHVEQAYGPWTASGEWWNPTAWESEEWDVIGRSGDGAVLHCCLSHDQAGGWRMVALYD
jgi:protein ImuB